MATMEHELSSRNSLASDPYDGSNDGIPLETRASRTQYALPPTDQGYHAWIALAGAFFSNFLIWGFALSFGILQEYYASNEPFASQGGIAAIGTTSTGVMYLTMPLFLWGFQRWPKARKWSLWASVPIIAVSLVGASFANTVPQLIVCQGIVYGIAGNALVMPTINLINEWFLQKRGLAIGVAMSGDFAGGVAMPLILQAVLNEVGFRWVSQLYVSQNVANVFTDHSFVDAPYCRSYNRHTRITASVPSEASSSSIGQPCSATRGSSLPQVAILLDSPAVQYDPSVGLLPTNKLSPHHRRKPRSRQNVRIVDYPLRELDRNFWLHRRWRSCRPLRRNTGLACPGHTFVHCGVHRSRLHHINRATLRLQSPVRLDGSSILHELGRRH
jgi:hypothetical protein